MLVVMFVDIRATLVSVRIGGIVGVIPFPQRGFVGARYQLVIKKLRACALPAFL